MAKDSILQKIQGFTLIELVVIITIIGILAAIPFYNWQGTAISIDAQAKQVANDIRYTQALAMTKAERYRLVRISATTYQIQNSSGVPITFPSGSTTQALDSDFVFAWTNLTNNLIAFDGNGTPYLNTAIPGTALVAGTVYSITISGVGNSETIVITPITGMVFIQ